jgi:hypothetical protein
VIPGVHRDEDEALDGEDGGGYHAEYRMPMEGVGEDERDGADEFDYAEDLPGLGWHGTEGGHALAYFVEEEDLHDA